MSGIFTLSQMVSISKILSLSEIFTSRQELSVSQTFTMSPFTTNILKQHRAYNQFTRPPQDSALNSLLTPHLFHLPLHLPNHPQPQPSTTSQYLQLTSSHQPLSQCPKPTNQISPVPSPYHSDSACVQAHPSSHTILGTRFLMS